MGRTHPYFRIHPQAPTASLVSLKVISSIIGQVLLTGAFQFWVFFWVQSQPWLVLSAMYPVACRRLKGETTGIHHQSLTREVMPWTHSIMRTPSCSYYPPSSISLLRRSLALAPPFDFRCGQTVANLLILANESLTCFILSPLDDFDSHVNNI